MTKQLSKEIESYRIFKKEVQKTWELHEKRDLLLLR